jgi:hypothetical protein
MFVLGIRGLLKNGNGNPHIGVVTNIGMLGTFLGIVLGLWDFDVNNINDSVPALLGGMKMAFITSVCGIFFYIVLKCVPPKKIIGPDDQTVIGLLKIIADNGNKNYDLIKTIEKSISGDGDTALLTQIQRLRVTTNDSLNAIKETTDDGLNEVNKSFKEFAEKQADNNSKALTDALKEVIKDFNAKINEQFSDNFKQLNEAVGRMLEWQDKYKEQIEKTTEQFGLALKGITEAKDVIVDLSGQASIYKETSIKLGEILDNLNTNLVGIGEMARNAENVFPIIKNNIEALTKDFSESVRLSIKENATMLEEQRTGIQEHINTLKQSFSDFGKQLDRDLKVEL